MTEDIKDRIKQALESLKEKGKEAPSKKRARPKTPPRSQTIIGNGNIAAGRDVNYRVTTARHETKIQPPPGSIGADSLLKIRIEGLFNDLGIARKKRFPNSSFEVMYGIFKRDFKIGKNHKWTIIWTWPSNMAPLIIEYLEEKLANTIGGRIRKSASAKNIIPTRPMLYAKERALLEHLGMTMKSPELRRLLKERFGATSHQDINHDQHMHLVAFLDDLVKKTIGETD